MPSWSRRVIELRPRRSAAQRAVARLRPVLSGDPKAGNYTHPLPLADLTKFDHVPGVARVYDSGNIVIYNLLGLGIMARSQADVAVTAAVAVLACGAAASGAPTAVMIVLGIALFAAPGYLLSQLLLSSRVAGLERVAVATGLALCVPILGGVLLNAAGVPLHRPAWLGLLAGLTLVCDVALFLRRRSAERRPSPGDRGGYGYGPGMPRLSLRLCWSPPAGWGSPG